MGRALSSRIEPVFATRWSATPAMNLPVDILFEKAGPREQIFFEPSKTSAAIVTCGGLCPELNNVIRSAFLELHENYGIREVWGIRYGYAGLNTGLGQPPIRLTPALMDEIHEVGGTMLGTSRGPQSTQAMVDFLRAPNPDPALCRWRRHAAGRQRPRRRGATTWLGDRGGRHSKNDR